jgi:hypothetical protein
MPPSTSCPSTSLFCQIELSNTAQQKHALRLLQAAKPHDKEQHEANCKLVNSTNQQPATSQWTAAIQAYNQTRAGRMHTAYQA